MIRSVPFLPQQGKFAALGGLDHAGLLATHDAAKPFCLWNFPNDQQQQKFHGSGIILAHEALSELSAFGSSSLTCHPERGNLAPEALNLVNVHT
jgi:hypothetical protein